MATSVLIEYLIFNFIRVIGHTDNLTVIRRPAFIRRPLVKGVPQKVVI